MNLLVQSPIIVTSIYILYKKKPIYNIAAVKRQKKNIKRIGQGCVFSLSLDHECTSFSYLAKSLPPLFFKKEFFKLNPHLTLPFNRPYVIAISEVYSVVSPFVYFDPIQH